MMRRHELCEFVKAALECSVYFCPTDPGLTLPELIEAGQKLGYGAGEIADVVDGVADRGHVGQTKLLPRVDQTWGMFHIPEEPDYRNVRAFDFICRELRNLARSQGAKRAQVERSVMIERGTATELSRRDLEVAIAVLVMTEHLTEANGVLHLAPGRETFPLPSEQVDQAHTANPAMPSVRKEGRARVYPVIKDVIERRTDGRLPHAEPLDAFDGELEKLELAPFRLWWTQTVAELRRLQPTLSPVAVCVLSAALVEGALTFVVKHARGRRLGVFGSKEFEREPRYWKIDDLVSSACTGRDSAILDTRSRQRADELIKLRQRIHAGRMLTDYPTGVPDLQPEEARDAKATADLVVRRVLDWLQKYPPASE